MNPSDKLLIPNYSQPGSFNFNFVSPSPAPEPSPHNPPVILKLPAMPATRSSARQRGSSNASGSEYHMSNASMDVDEQDVQEEEEEEEEEPQPVYTKTSRGRKVAAKDYRESSDAEDQQEDGEGDPIDFIDGPHAKDDGGALKAEDDEDDEDGMRYSLRTRKKRGSINGFILSSDEDRAPRGRILRSGQRPSAPQTNGRVGRTKAKRKPQKQQPTRQSSRRTRVNARQDEQDGNYEDEGSATSSAGSAAGSVVEEGPDDALDDLDAAGDADAEGEAEAEEQENDGKPYSFRQRAKVNYAILPPIEEMRAPPPKQRNNKAGNGARHLAGRRCSLCLAGSRAPRARRWRSRRSARHCALARVCCGERRGRIRPHARRAD
ncbi:hypothetical protein PsYK624_173350 [Phanerochaete sordida]|uniref:Uncharacterized protein n=1 Tax=Phanerochaete sordida TaxID=48140 RepID=A0A9P3GSI5_9APHY|nr:hypothetical protein PsYK624_173350 [Phanerochaete sordida]